MAGNFVVVVKSSRTTSRVNCDQKPNVSETITPISGGIIPLIMEAEMVSETLGFCPQLTRLIAREDFIEFCLRESFKAYLWLWSTTLR
jgi:hypothetical protein